VGGSTRAVNAQRVTTPSATPNGDDGYRPPADDRPLAVARRPEKPARDDRLTAGGPVVAPRARSDGERGAQASRRTGGRAKDVLGRFGEDLAARHFVDAGAEILDRNWRCRDGELDIVALEADTLVFCEVRTRTGTRHGTPAESVDWRKTARIRRLAARWLAEHPRPFGPVRFDLIAVSRDLAPGRPPAVRLDHRRGAF
jgi:putative endonuclease